MRSPETESDMCVSEELIFNASAAAEPRESQIYLKTKTRRHYTFIKKIYIYLFILF